ncbi:MAG TPA: hypothetical protein VFZ36_03045 [Vicinamibacterales bacterium]
MLDPGIRSPLVDMFRHGDTDIDIRLHAARGALAPRGLEQLALLMVLSGDPDERVRQAAGETIDRIPAFMLSAFIARPDVPETMRQWFAGRAGLTPQPGAPVDPDAPLIEEEGKEEGKEEGEQGEGDEEETKKLLSLMTVLERLKLAMRGTREQRAALVRDPNKMVAAAVLSSPKLTESEVESFSKMTTVAEEVLRIIGANRAWTRNYGVALGLARNPKTPTGVALQFVQRLNERDMKQISTDRNVPEPVRLAVRKYLIKTQKGA